MKIFYYLIIGYYFFLTPGFSQMASSKEDGVWVSDLGNGKYKNPVLHLDFSDPDAIRVGDDYYMTASSFNHVPGLPILHSKDLVNWSLLGYALKRNIPEVHFQTVRSGGGVWAPSIRFQNNEFYIYYPDPDFGIYLVKAKNINGPWSDPILVEGGKGLIDPCPLWDTDGKVYLVHGYAGSRAGFKSVIVVKEIFAPAGGVSTGWQLVLRSKNVYGPYERRVVIDQGNTAINGPHQGAWVDTKSGEHWFLHFQDKEAYGRIVHLQPMTWKNDWPMIGIDRDGDGKGEPVLEYTKPKTGFVSPDRMPYSDEFTSHTIGKQWQWQANPVANRTFPFNGHLRMFAARIPDSLKNLWEFPALLMQKFPAEAFTMTTKMNFTPNLEGEKAGLIVFGANYASIYLEKKKEGLQVVFSICNEADKGKPERIISGDMVKSGLVYFRATVQPGGICSLSFSEDGSNFKPLGEMLSAKPGRWVGAKAGPFCTTVSGGNDAGFIDIDWFRVTTN
jgi:beta-xylosidase